MIKNYSPQETEEAILHILMVLPEKYFSLSMLKSYMFSALPHIEIFNLIDEEIKDKTSIDFHILVEKAKAKDDIEREGGLKFLEKLRDKEGINPDNIIKYEGIVVDAWKARKVETICTSVPSQIKNVKNIQDIIIKMRKQLDGLDSNISTESVSSLEVLSPLAWEEISNRTDSPGISGISTGLTGLDLKTAGMNGGDLWYVAGRPGMGKTATICNMILDGAKHNKRGLLCSLEMRKQLLIERLLAIHTGIHLYPDIRMGNLNKENLLIIQRALEVFRTYPIFLDTNFVPSLEYLEMMIRKYKHSEDIDVVYVDYVQLLAERDADATQALGRISRKFKLLAEELDVPIIVASQLSRAVEARSDKRPVLSDLRQSGNLEEDADVVLGLYRDKKYNMKTADPRLMECNVIKQRNGPTGTVYLDFEEETNRLKDKEGFYGEQAKTKGYEVGKEISRVAEPQVKEDFF